MKNLFNVRGCKFLLAGVLMVCGLMFSASKVAAQTVNWVSPAEATTRLNTQLNTLYPQLAVETPGTSQYTAVQRRIVYYKSTVSLLAAGSTLPVAVDRALLEAASVNSENQDQVNRQVTVALQTLRTEITDLLSD